MPFITITITGLNEVIQRNQRMIQEASNIKLQVLQEGANFLADEMRRNAHVITGTMRNSIAVQSVTDREAIVVVAAPYAWYENKRIGGIQGPHDFADRALSATIREFPNMIMSAFSRWASL